MHSALVSAKLLFNAIPYTRTCFLFVLSATAATTHKRLKLSSGSANLVFNAGHEQPIYSFVSDSDAMSPTTAIPLLGIFNGMASNQ